MDDKNKQYNIAAIGPSTMISGFKALGVIPHSANNSEEALQELLKIQNGESKYAVVIIMEDLVRGIPVEDYKKATREALPAVVALPTVQGSTGYGEEKLKMIAEKAIGSSIL